ncbi:Unknown protein [Striga hermonthica]|uniref:Uncharacterized protein n=1 Tax=Striga hermonthica TaxID=68872 RepID=A0A9N7MKD2_STRHE|nr:Unknown protein [Striga hermonthica]
MTCAAGGVITVVAKMVKGYAQNQLSQPVIFGNWRLALTWGPGFCRPPPGGSSPCSKPIQPRFSVHGLWAYDMTSRIIVRDEGIGKLALDMIIFKLLRRYLEREWPSLIGSHDNERFWTYEWHKHAQMLNLSPPKYFLKALQYKWTVDFLTNGGLEVFLGYPRTEVTSVLCQQIQGLVKAIPVVVCSKVHKGLLEIQLCFDHVSDTFTDCANNILQCVHSSCGSNVVIGS